MKQTYFVTGTDTGVGKTMISAALVSGFLHCGLRVRYFKPMQTGIAHGHHDDATWVMQHAGISDDVVIPSLYRLKLPASPDCAARHEGLHIAFDSIVNTAVKHAANCDILVIEGAGGLLVPIDGTHTILDLINATNAAPVLVTRGRLGTLNHTALTWRELARANRHPSALVINDTEPVSDPDDAIVRSDNRRQLTAMVYPVPVIHVEHSTHISTALLETYGQSIIAALRGSHA